jgi:hypothetical protein
MTEEIDKPVLTLVVEDDSTDNGHEDVTPEARVICEVKQFQDGDGRHIIARFPVDQPDNPSFVGNFVVPVEVGPGMVRPIQMEITFPEGYAIEDCFEQFDELAQKTLEEAKESAEDQNRIVTPDQMRGGNDLKIVT